MNINNIAAVVVVQDKSTDFVAMTLDQSGGDYIQSDEEVGLSVLAGKVFL